jgi:hypothetical protein
LKLGSAARARRQPGRRCGVAGAWILASERYISCPLSFSHPTTLVFMQLRRLLALAALSLLAMSNSCKKEDMAPCNAAADVTLTPLAGLRASISEPVPYVGQTNEYVINSAAEYHELFGTKKLPPVDFARHTLLAGKTRTASSYHLLAQQVVQTCTGFTYAVQLAPDAAPKVASVVYFVLVPKLPAAAKVAFEVQLLASGGTDEVSTLVAK